MTLPQLLEDATTTVSGSAEPRLRTGRVVYFPYLPDETSSAPPGSTLWDADPGTTVAPWPNRETWREPRELLLEARLRSGLTWEELAACLGVSRRTVHFWASGRRLAPEHEARLREFYRVVDAVDRGLPSLTRSAIMVEVLDGLRGFDLLRQGRFDEAIAFVGVGAPAPRSHPRPLAPEAREARRPPRPVDLLGSPDDEPVEDAGPARRVRPRRARRGEPADGKP